MLRRLSPVLACLALIFTAATPAAAQDLTPSEARAMADRLIAKGEAGTYFENVSDDAVPAARHRLSGMVCLFGPEERTNSITIIASGLVPLGDDVACGTRLGGQTLTLYATRYGGGFTAQQSLDGAVDAIRQRWSEARPFEGDIFAPSGDGLPPILSAGFYAELEGRSLYTQVSTAAVGTWILKLRMTGPAETAKQAQTLGGAYFGYAVDHAGKEPGERP